MSVARVQIHEFVSEAREHLGGVADDLLALEQRREGEVRPRVDRVFRAVHSIKGGAGFFGCKTIESLAHAMEAVLEHQREQSDPPSAAVVDALLAGVDRLLALLDDVERSNDVDVSALVTRLRGLTPNAVLAPIPNLTLDFVGTALTERPAEHLYLYGLKIDLSECHRRRKLSPLDVIGRLLDHGAILNARLDAPEASLDAPVGTTGIDYRVLFSTSLPPERLSAALDLPAVEIVLLEPQRPTAVADAPEPSRTVSERSESIRIPVQLVDRLMTLAGELVLVRNQAARTLGRDRTFGPVVQRLDAVTSEIQDAVMRTRMQPIGNLFGRFPRLVRDLARQLGKEIDLEASGAEVELDKTILEALSDPLTHLVRNCCDHGIETPERRRQLGKSSAGLISLSARHLGGQIFIEVRDDGKGLDPEAIRRKAVQRGLRSASEASRLGTRELLSLILLPGFSTAEQVTDVSGRGVGMDVVKTNVDRLGGVLEIESEPGRGTTFSLRLPLTLAIIPCLIVTAGGERYAIPQKDLEEFVCVRPGQGRTQIESAHDQEVVRLRERLLPLVRLPEVLARRQPFTVATRTEILRKHRPRRDSADNSTPLIYFAVVKAGSQRFGLIVDDILTTEEVVVKPVHAILKPLAAFSGATILGDGRVALILSIEGVARHAGVTFDVNEEQPLIERNYGPSAESQAVLLFRYGPDEQFAVPLATIRRIETVRMERVERVGEQEFVTVDGISTRILRPDRFLSVSACEPRTEMFLLLPKNPRRPAGVLLSAVVDTDTVSADVTSNAYRADGVVGSAVVRGRMTLFLDVYRLLDSLEPSVTTLALPPPRSGRILLVEDTQFFRSLVKGYLEAAGYEVVTADNGAEGLAALDRGSFDVIVTDIEMPVLDGWGFARGLRARPDGSRIPLLALTTLGSEADRARAEALGFDGYELKLDRERFLEAVAVLRSRR